MGTFPMAWSFVCFFSSHFRFTQIKELDAGDSGGELACAGGVSNQEQ